MTTHVYTVHEKNDPEAADAIFVKEGFTIWAFVLTFVWLFFHRAWLAGATVLMLVLALVFAAPRLGLGMMETLALRLALNFAVGVFATDLYRVALARRGYEFAGTVAAGSKEEAELRYYAGLGERPSDVPREPEPAQIVTA